MKSSFLKKRSNLLPRKNQKKAVTLESRGQTSSLDSNILLRHNNQGKVKMQGGAVEMSVLAPHPFHHLPNHGRQSSDSERRAQVALLGDFGRQGFFTACSTWPTFCFQVGTESHFLYSTKLCGSHTPAIKYARESKLKAVWPKSLETDKTYDLLGQMC